MKWTLTLRFTVIFTASSPQRVRSLTIEDTRQSTFFRAHPAPRSNAAFKRREGRQRDLKRNSKNDESYASPLTAGQCSLNSLCSHCLICFPLTFSLAVLRPRYAMHAGKDKKTKRGHNCSCAALIGATREMLFVILVLLTSPS